MTDVKTFIEFVTPLINVLGWATVGILYIQYKGGGFPFQRLREKEDMRELEKSVKHRCSGDVVVEHFMSVSRNQTELMTEMVSLQRQLVETTKKTSDVLEGGIDRQKEMALQLKYVYEHGIGKT